MDHFTAELFSNMVPKRCKIAKQNVVIAKTLSSLCHCNSSKKKEAL